jgi:hypothetical protein
MNMKQMIKRTSIGVVIFGGLILYIAFLFGYAFPWREMAPVEINQVPVNLASAEESLFD